MNYFRLMTGLFYPQHILYVKSCELAFEDCFYAKKWMEALDYGHLCLNAYKAFTLGNQVSFPHYYHFCLKEIFFHRFGEIWDH